MVSLGGVIFELIENVSLIALVVGGYATIRRGALPLRGMESIAVGVLFGLGAVLAMTLRIEVMPGVFVDSRNIMTALVVVFGGPVATVITLAITSLYRFWLGGGGALAGSVAAIASAGVGFAFCALRTRYGF